MIAEHVMPLTQLIIRIETRPARPPRQSDRSASRVPRQLRDELYRGAMRGNPPGTARVVHHYAYRDALRRPGRPTPRAGGMVSRCRRWAFRFCVAWGEPAS